MNNVSFDCKISEPQISVASPLPFRIAIQDVQNISSSESEQEDHFENKQNQKRRGFMDQRSKC